MIGLQTSRHPELRGTVLRLEANRNRDPDTSPLSDSLHRFQRGGPSEGDDCGDRRAAAKEGV